VGRGIGITGGFLGRRVDDCGGAGTPRTTGQCPWLVWIQPTSRSTPTVSPRRGETDQSNAMLRIDGRRSSRLSWQIRIRDTPVDRTTPQQPMIACPRWPVPCPRASWPSAAPTPCRPRPWAVRHPRGPRRCRERRRPQRNRLCGRAPRGRSRRWRKPPALAGDEPGPRSVGSPICQAGSCTPRSRRRARHYTSSGRAAAFPLPVVARHPSRSGCGRFSQRCWCPRGRPAAR
jgi:hypothetical protein